MNSDYKRMLVVGITYNKVERGVYALILQELGGTRRLPIIIGMSEAQSIECKLQNIVTPRPLTHDLVVNIMRAFGLNLKFVVIKQIEGGIFAADLHLSDADRSVVIDARSSDGISIAIRIGVPVYVSEELLARVGTPVANHDMDREEDRAKATVHREETETGSAFWHKAETMDTEHLERYLNEFVAKEAYEEAAKLRDIIKRRSGGVVDAEKS